MNPYRRYPVLTFFIVDHPLNDVVEGFWYDATVRVRDYSGVPKYMADAFERLKNRYPPTSSYLCRRRVPFDLGWTYRFSPTRYDPKDHPHPGLFWTPRNATGKTAVMVNDFQGDQVFLGPCIGCRDWQFFWTYIDDADPKASVCWFEFLANRESIHREVWAGFDTDDEDKPK